MEKIIKPIKNFYDITEEEWDEIVKRDMENIKNEKNFMSYEEILQHWKERYGIDIENKIDK